MDEARDVRVQPLDYLHILRRRVRWFIIPAVTILVLGTAITFLWPAKYRSIVTIAITGGSLSSDLTHPIDREERARALSQHLVEPTMLSRVARIEHLTAAAPTEVDIMGLRNRVQVTVPTPLPGGGDPTPADTYLIAYSDSTPERARRVAQRLADAFVEETSKTQQVRLEDTSEFLASRLREAREQMTRLDEKITGAKARNMGRLPEQMNANVQMVQTLRQQLDSASTQLRGEQDRLDTINRTISLLEQQSPETSGGTVATTAQQRVRQIERDLAVARMKYSEKHPDVQELEDELARAKKDAAAERNMPLADKQVLLSESPAYRQAIGERQATEQRMRDLKRQMDVYGSQIHAYESRLEGAPLAEQELRGLQQERDLIAKQYDDLTAKLNTAQLQEDSERKRGSEHFRVLYPATLPDAPYEPNRPRLLLMTFGAALLLGIGSAIGREYLDQSIHDARTLQEFEVPVLGEIPHIRRVA